MWGTVRSPGNKLITNLPYNYLLDKLNAGVRQCADVIKTQTGYCCHQVYVI